MVLARRALLWRILLRLVRALEEGPGTPLSADALIEAGWPDERILHEAARPRLYTAVRDLRKAGLGGHRSRRDGGYLLAPTLRVERS